jgi:hypothetical protein
MAARPLALAMREDRASREQGLRRPLFVRRERPHGLSGEDGIHAKGGAPLLRGMTAAVSGVWAPTVGMLLLPFYGSDVT